MRKRDRVVDEPEPNERLHRERCVAKPGVAVVPVALAADLLGQTCRRRRHGRARGRVGEELERDRRSIHHVAPPTSIRRAVEPVSPRLDRLLEERVERVGGDALRRCVGRRFEDEPSDVARTQGQFTDHIVLTAFERHRGVQRQRRLPALEHGAVLGGAQRVLRPPVVEPRRHLESEGPGARRPATAAGRRDHHRARPGRRPDQGARPGRGVGRPGAAAAAAGPGGRGGGATGRRLAPERRRSRPCWLAGKGAGRGGSGGQSAARRQQPGCARPWSPPR